MICVVGAGAAGLACAAMLRRAGAEVVVLERDDVGAAWETRYDCHHDVGLMAAVRDGQVRVVPALERFEDGVAVLADGRAVKVDAIVADTGYRTGLGPLVGHLGVLDEAGVPLVHGTDEHPVAPGLHFVGYEVTLGGTLRLVGKRAEQLARAAA